MIDLLAVRGLIKLWYLYTALYV